MTQAARSAEYAKEIRDWMVGRVSSAPAVGGTVPKRDRLPQGRILYWWILEGKLYPWLDASLADSWQEIEAHARRLLGSYNPRWSATDAPEGETDWLSSALQSVTASRRVFVSRASRPGLDDDERRALKGWVAWISWLWTDYQRELRSEEAAAERIAELAPLGSVVGAGPAQIDRRTLLSWARIAKRSRWPLLRNVVSESIRAFFEEQQIDRLPLPADHATLFELLCMVRILSCLEATPKHVRWLDRSQNKNEIQTKGMVYAYQHTLSKQDVLGTMEFGEGLREAMVRYEVRTPKLIDGWLRFDKPVAGFAGVLVEAKSGAQLYGDAVLQLKAYRAALRKQGAGRLLVWGITEEPGKAPEFDLVRDAPVEAGPYADDCWVFSSAGEIGKVLAGVGLVDAVGG
jgi:hypothetical protein